MAASALIAAGASLLPYLAKAPKALKAIYRSKAFTPAMLGALFFGQEALSLHGKSGERELTAEQLKLQQVLSEAGMEATKRSVKESRAQTKKYMAELAKVKRQEAKDARDTALMQSFVTSQDRQMALTLQALQGVAQSTPALGTTPTQTPYAGPGMLGMIRSSL